MPKAIVIRAAGTNCDGEMVRAFELAGAGTELVHLGRVAEEPARLDEYDLIGFPGGFSFGDDIASGRIFAMKLREHVYPALRAAAERGVLMIGACNGFQVLVQCGLLPGPGKTGEVGAGGWPPDRAPEQTVALCDNARGRFVDRWVGVEYVASSVCVWTKGVGELVGDEDRRDVMQLPVAHGEGRFVTANASVLRGLEAGGQVAVRYTDNYNGSEGAIAGICDATGRIFGLMPHPERYLEWNRHPYWTRLGAGVRSGATPGMRIFRNAVEAVGTRVVQGAMV
jgi:phosphoribosylformylglycinamidine synthase